MEVQSRTGDGIPQSRGSQNTKNPRAPSTSLSGREAPEQPRGQEVTRGKKMCAQWEAEGWFYPNPCELAGTSLGWMNMAQQS